MAQVRVQQFTRIPTLLIRDYARTLPSTCTVLLQTLCHLTLDYDRIEAPLPQKLLADYCGCSTRTVRSCLTTLESRGLIAVRHRYNKTSVYRLTIPGVSLSSDRASARQISATIPPAEIRHMNSDLSSESELLSRAGSSSPIEEEDSSPSWSLSPDEVLSPPDTQQAFQAAQSAIEGHILRRPKPAEILETIREIKAEALNRQLEIDLTSLVVEAIQAGIEANRRKNGGVSTIFAFSYFKGGMLARLDQAANQVRIHERIQQIQEQHAQVESEREEARSRQITEARSKIEDLTQEERNDLEWAAWQGLPGFLKASVRRDREASERGPGQIALEHAMYRLIDEGWEPSRSSSPVGDTL